MSGLILPGSVPNLNIGGRAAVDLSTNLLQLWFQLSNVNINCGLRRFQDTVAYLPTGKNLRIFAVQFQGTAAGIFASLGYADNDPGYATTTGLTNQKSIGGLAFSATNQLSSPAASQLVQQPIDILVPNGKYPVAQYTLGTGTLFGLAFGYLE